MPGVGRTAVSDGSYWIKQREPYYVQTGAAFENPYGMPPDEIERYIKNHTAENVAQVIFGKYVDNSGLVFTGELVSQMFWPEPTIRDERYFDKARWSRAVQAFRMRGGRKRFAGGIDLARQKDHTVITVLDVAKASVETPATVLYWRRTNRVP